MPREPAPPVGMLFDNELLAHYHQVIRLNPSVHDGAIMIGRQSDMSPYAIVGWSYRLFPPFAGVALEPNRGSAFNSSVEMSTVATVDRLYLVTGGVLLLFQGGKVSKIVRN